MLFVRNHGHVREVKGDGHQIWRIRSGEPSAAEPQTPDVRVNHEHRNFGASYNYRVHQALGNLHTPRRF